MKNVSRLLIIVLLSLSIAMFLTNCGNDEDGGGGLPGLTYTGLTIPVPIDENNAESVAANAYQNSNTMRNTNVMGAVKADESGIRISRPYGVALARSILDFLDQADIPSSSAGNITAAAMQPETEYGTCGTNPGSVTYTGTVNEATGDFNITAAFSSYCTNGDGVSSGVVTNGKIQMNGQINEGAGTMHVNATFSNFVVTLIDTGVSATTSGSMNMHIESSSASITMNMLMRDSSTEKTYKVENLQINMSNILSDPANFSMSGRFFDPDYGYSDIATEQVFEVYSGDNAPSSGIMVINGANGVAGGSTKAKLTVLNNTQYQVEADTNGDGTYDYDTGPQNW
ncbi:MAG: hypothetical protein KAJ10_09505 [Thermodesulfovibrionia bacterium]|nr:hypothetical protein [Thermodesulfovibrionia bacterium]